MNIGFYSRHDYSWLLPRDKHATISVLTFRQQDLPAQDNYLVEAQAQYSVHWLKRKTGIFQTEIAETIKKLNAQFHPRGHNRVMECLQFGGNHEFWHDFPDEEEITIYFRHCYEFAVRYIIYPLHKYNTIKMNDCQEYNGDTIEFFDNL